MRLYSYFSFLVLFFTVNSEAQLRCFNLFTENKVETPQYYAEVIDSLNLKYNNFLFEASLSEALRPDLDNKSFPQQTKARYQAFKLRRMLKTLKSSEFWDQYDFENFAKKLERLTFLSDLSVTKTMTLKDKTLYLQARHSLLAKGLENFLFFDSKTSPSMKRKIFNWVMVPFKDIYLRWTYALFYMPKLNGAVLPVNIATKIAWEGLDKNQDLLKPYLRNSQFKSFFNVFSTTYNYTLVAALFIGLPAYSYFTYTQIQEKGSAQVQILFKPLVQHSEELAKTNFHVLASEKSLQYFKEEFVLKFGREPNAEELAFAQKLKGF